MVLSIEGDGHDPSISSLPLRNRNVFLRPSGLEADYIVRLSMSFPPINSFSPRTNSGDGQMNTLYFVETTSPRLGNWFLECDRDTNSRASAIRQIREGDIIKVLEVNEDAGTVRDVTDELKEEAAQGPSWNAANRTWEYA